MIGDVVTLWLQVISAVFCLFMFMLLLHRLTWSDEFKRQRELKRGPNLYAYGYKDVIIGTLFVSLLPLILVVLANAPNHR
jgi:hypothetical protein